MFQSFEDVAPSSNELTSYDRDHTMLDICLLDRQARGQDWRTTARAFFGLDAEHEPGRAHTVYDSHLARATALQSVPSCAMMQKMTPYL